MEAFNALVQSPLVQPFVALLGGAALLALFWWRTGSIRSVLDRVWHLLAGSTDVNDPILKQVLVNSRDLERFRFTYRIKVDSLDDVHKLHAWIQQHRVDIAALSRAREWVDVKRPELIKEPPKAYFKWKLWPAFVFLVMVYALGLFLLPSGALLHAKDSGTYFRMQEFSVQHPLWIWSISSSDCKSSVDKIPGKTGFTATEAILICGLFHEGKVKHFIEENQGSQRWLFGGVLLLWFFWFLPSLWKIDAAQAAIDLRRRTDGADQTPEEKGVEP